jgi:putative membrane protein insertion efficiency factor
MKDFLQKLATHFFLSLVRTYQLLISPLFLPTCRFTPTCSQYAIDAIKCHGIIRGCYMALRRIMRCHPFNDGGYDPIK